MNMLRCSNGDVVQHRYGGKLFLCAAQTCKTAGEKGRARCAISSKHLVDGLAQDRLKTSGVRGTGLPQTFYDTQSSCWLILLLACLAGVAGAAPKDNAEKKLRQMERTRAGTLAAQTAASRAAAGAAAREAVLAAERTQAVSRLRVIEMRVQEAASLALQAKAAQTAAEADIARRSESLAAMLPLALRLSRSPAETLLEVSAPPGPAVEGLLAAHGVAAELAGEARALREAQDKAGVSRAALISRRSALNAEQAHQVQAAAALDRQIGQADEVRARALDQVAVEAQQAALLAAQAQDLRGAIGAMDAAQKRREAEAARAAHGRKRPQPSEAVQLGPGLGSGMPRATLVTGRLIRQWGAPSEDGPASGITYDVVPGAYVSAPCAGHVAFAAPFRSYGRLMIISCGQAYDFVLAGMDRLDARVGREVRAGEPIGRMPQARTAGGGTPLLYVELRRNGEPIDPLPYLNARR